MKHALELITFNKLGDPSLAVELAIEAEDCGWDGIFLPDHLVWRTNVYNIIDPWITLSAIATQTSKLKLICITPLTRRHPWVLAKQLATLDQLSKGRVMLGTGIGSPARDFTAFGMPYNPVDLGRQLDEALEVLNGLWSGTSFSYQGEFYQIDDVHFTPTPYQRPRIPIILGGWWPKKNPIKRGARWDGIMPVPAEYPKQFSFEDLNDLIGFYKGLKNGNLGDICIKINRAKDDPFNAECKKLGVTWGFEMLMDFDFSIQQQGAKISTKEVDNSSFFEFVRDGPST